jgi:hypothetical protein
MVHARAVVAVVEGAFLLAVGGIVGRIEVQEDLLGGGVLAALAHVEFDQGPGDAQAVLRTRGILQAREGRLAREIRPRFG